MIRLLLLLSILFLQGRFTAHGQNFQLVSEKAEVIIEGTSTLHDWHSDVTSVRGSAMISTKGTRIEAVSELSVVMQVSSIESGKKGMDKNTYEALKEAENPEIRFVLTRAENIGDSTLRGRGLLSIAGVSRDMSIDTDYHFIDESTIEFSGSATLNMTDYDVEPPTALLGTVKTGNGVTVTFHVQFLKEGN